MFAFRRALGTGDAKKLLCAVITVVLLTSSLSAQGPTHPWETATADETLADRFPVPEGFERLSGTTDGFAQWLRSLPVLPEGTKVQLYDGRLKSRQDVHLAVFDIDVGNRDLQQCADAVMRLRAEFLLEQGCGQEVRFDFTNGDVARWSDWSRGLRPIVRGNHVEWRRSAAEDPSYDSFRSYLTTVFTYAGSASLERELEPVSDPSAIHPGDVFIEGGFPGHAVLVVDVAENSQGDRLFLLAQSYMPAQQIHILRNPKDPEHAWYPARSEGPLATPEWLFDFADLRRFPSTRCLGDQGM